MSEDKTKVCFKDTLLVGAAGLRLPELGEAGGRAVVIEGSGKSRHKTAGWQEAASVILPTAVPPRIL